MGTWNLGSVSDTVYNTIDNVPSTISGAQLIAIADRQREYVETYTGASIGSNSIDILYQNAILNLSISNTLNLMQTLGADVSQYKLGDFSVGKGKSSNLAAASDYFKTRAEEELSIIGRKSRFFKAYGWYKMVELKYIGQHAPNEIVNVLDKRVDEFIKTGLYEKVGDNLIKSHSPIKKGVEKKESFDEVLDDDEE